jgi:2-polyprenyl-6-methoxyphenol hydroxylase-like FAD-dependent oxidoreductase
MAGLLAARVLTEHFARVTIIERDELPAGDEGRAGVPQGRHGHALLVGGRQNIEGLFPGITAELIDAGAPLIDQGLDALSLFKTGWAPRIKSGVMALCLSRPLLESRVRRRVAALPGVTIRERTEVVGLIGNGPRVSGVRARRRGEAGAAEEPILADLVVEASGRASRLPDFLAELGYDRPEQTVVNAYVGYASRYFTPPEGVTFGWKGIWLQTRPPRGARGGILLPTEGGKWLVTLMGVGRDYPPTDEDGFMAFARSLPTPVLYDAIKDARPEGSIAGFRRMENRLYHYERLRRRPENVIALGDAACALNPTYAQGMSVASFSALALGEELRAWRRGGLDGFAARFQRRLAKLVAPAWMMATSEDARWPATEGAPDDGPTRFMHWYTDQVFGLVAQRADVYAAFLQVMHMLKPSTALFAPWLVAAVARAALGRPRRGPAPEAELPAPAA